MTCERVELPGGMLAIICSRTPVRRCTVCKQNVVTRLCDAPKRPRWSPEMQVALDAARSGRVALALELARADKTGAYSFTHARATVMRAAAGEEPTCSRGLCDRCAVSFDGEQDLCPLHAARAFRAWAANLLAGAVPPPAFAAGVDVLVASTPALEVV